MKITAKVKPNSNENKIVKTLEGEYEVFVREPAKDNRANNAVLKLVAKELGVSWRNLQVKNPTSRKKIIEVGEQ